MDIGGFDKHKGKGKGKDKGKKGGKDSGKGGKNASKGSKGKGKGQGAKETRNCHNCGKPGHLVKDCWSAGGGAANPKQKPKNSQGQQKKGDSKGKKGVSNLEEQPAPNEPEAETGFLSIAGLEESEVKQEVKTEEEFITVEIDPGEYVEIPCDPFAPCKQPCDMCIFHGCKKLLGHEELEKDMHVCNVCMEDFEKAKEEGNKPQAVREVLKMTPPEEFSQVIDKTICLMKGMTKEAFKKLSFKEQEQLRAVLDPKGKHRSINDDIIDECEKRRNELRLKYFERVTEVLMEASQTFGHGTASGSMDEPSQSSGLAELPSRPTGTASGTLMHRTIEQMEISNLDAMKREKAQEIEEAEDEETIQRLEAEMKEIENQKTKMKDKIKEDDKSLREKEKEGKQTLTEANLHDQSWHDARYHAAVRSGVSHSEAWRQEKKRRKATIHRQSGTSERARERLELDKKWHEEFDTGKVQDDEFHDEAASNIETEGVEEVGDGKIKVLKGKALQIKRGELKAKDFGKFMRSQRSYRRLTQEEVSKFRSETKEDEERVMRKRRVNIFQSRVRKMTVDKKEKRKQRVKKVRKRRIDADREDMGIEYGGRFYLLNPKAGPRCEDFRRSYCKRGAKCKFDHSETDRELKFIEDRHARMEKASKRVRLKPKVPESEEVTEINSYETGDPHPDAAVVEDGWTKVVANFDTGAAVTAVPKWLAENLGATGKDPNDKSYKTASGELLPDEGSINLKGYNCDGYKRSIDGRVVNVHRLLVSGRAVCKKNEVFLCGPEGFILPSGGAIADGMRKALKQLMTKYPGEAGNITKMYEHKGIYCFDMWVRSLENAPAKADDLAAFGQGFSRQVLTP